MTGVRKQAKAACAHIEGAPKVGQHDGVGVVSSHAACQAARHLHAVDLAVGGHHLLLHCPLVGSCQGGTCMQDSGASTMSAANTYCPTALM